jgi:NTE family protein
MKNTTPTALVFAGGGSHGAVQVGMIRALLSHGLHADFVVGASAGAINAAWFARDPCADEVNKLDLLWRGIMRREIMPLSLRSLWNLVTRADAIFDGQALRALLVRNLGELSFDDCKVPLHIVATDHLSGDEVVLSSGSVVDALMASTAIPGIFPPVAIGGRELVDGGVTNNTPLSTAVRLGARRVVVLPTGYACALANRPRGVVSNAMNALNHLVTRQLISDVQRYCGDVEIVVVPSLCPLDVSSYDYSKGAALIERAALQTLAWLADGGEQRFEMPQLTVHPH